MATPGTIKMETSVPPIQQNGGIYSELPVHFTSDVTIDGTATIGAISFTNLSVNGTATITSNSANALDVGPNGATNPVLQVDGSTASAATGLKLTGAAAAAGFALAVISSGTNEPLTIDAKGSGLFTVNGTGTGLFKVGHGFSMSTSSLSGAGAVNVSSVTTKITSTGANALTLADGSDGQIKILVMVVDGGDATLTPTTKTGFSTIVFNDVGDSCMLVFFTTLGWMVVSNNGCTIS
jgi:hypothetical protein